MGGPNRPYRGFKVTIGGTHETEIRMTEITREVVKFCKQPYIDFYAMKHELGGDGNHLHLHVLVFIAPLTHRSPKFSGGKICDNYNKTWRAHCPVLKERYDIEGKHMFVVTGLYDIDWLENYMWKESDMPEEYQKLPPDPFELQPYLAEKQKEAKAADPKLAKYEKLMRASGLNEYSNLQEVSEWLVEAQYKDKTMAVCRREDVEAQLARNCYKYLTGDVSLSRTLKRNIVPTLEGPAELQESANTHNKRLKLLRIE